MATQKIKPPARRKSPAVGPDKAAGKQPEDEHLLTEPVDLTPPKSEQEAQNQADEQVLLPHERDQTTRREGTGLGNENERSRAVIGQAAEDTESGLKDTDRRGIPSDIVASNTDAPNVPERARRKKP